MRPRPATAVSPRASRTKPPATPARFAHSPGLFGTRFSQLVGPLEISSMRRLPLSGTTGTLSYLKLRKPRRPPGLGKPMIRRCKWRKSPETLARAGSRPRSEWGRGPALVLRGAEAKLLEMTWLYSVNAERPRLWVLTLIIVFPHHIYG